MMKRISAVLVFLLGFSLVCRGAGKIDFTAEAPQAVVSGEQFQVQYALTAVGKDLRTPSFEGFDVLYGPTATVSHNFSNINGQESSQTTTTYTIVLLAKKEGSYEVPPATVKADGRQYTSNALTVKVLPPDKTAAKSGLAAVGGSGSAEASDAAVSGEQLFMVLHLSRKKVYEQEAVLATLKLYMRANVSSITSANFPDFSGFLVQEIEQPKNLQPVMENYNGVNYSTAVIKQWLLFPQRSGKLEIGKASLELAVQVPNRRQARSLFDMMDLYQEVKKEIASRPVTLDATALPFGKPASYMGGVGNFSIQSDISATTVKANEAVTVKIVVSGNGNLRYVKNPEIKFPDDFETYDPKIDLATKTTANGLTGTKTIEYTTVPRFAGDFTIPGVEFSYFDPQSGSYKTLQTEPFRLTVEKGSGDASAGPVVSNFTNQENLKRLGEDIRFLNLRPTTLRKAPTFLYGMLGYGLGYLLPALLFIVFAFVYRKQARANADIVLMKTRKANKVARKRLRLAGKYLKEHNKDCFYDEVLKATWGYLSDKLSIPVSDLTKEKVADELARYGAPETLANDFIGVLDTCEFARYAPAQSDRAMDDLYASAVKAIEEMENRVKK